MPAHDAGRYRSRPGGELAQFETLIYEKHGAVARISLNRPRVLNAYNIQMRDDLSQALSAVAGKIKNVADKKKVISR